MPKGKILIKLIMWGILGISKHTMESINHNFCFINFKNHLNSVTL